MNKVSILHKGMMGNTKRATFSLIPDNSASASTNSFLIFLKKEKAHFKFTKLSMIHC